jgi:hypothetical protein
MRTWVFDTDLRSLRHTGGAGGSILVQIRNLLRSYKVRPCRPDHDPNAMIALVVRQLHTFAAVIHR